MQSADEIEDAPTQLSVEAARAYVDARTQGLCHDGALEVALGVDRSVAEGSDRIETVEFKLAHLERAVQELSDVVYRQQQQLDAALALNQRLREQMQEFEGRASDASAVEIPPHY
jgi:SlyX protein